MKFFGREVKFRTRLNSYCCDQCIFRGDACIDLVKLHGEVPCCDEFGETIGYFYFD